MSASSYFYPGTDILINHADIRDHSQLEVFERRATAARAWELEQKPIKGQFDFQHLKDIHGHLFQDVYPFAGKVRTTNIRKPNSDWFCDFNMIDRQASYVFDELRNHSFLKRLSVEGFADRAAFFYEQINFMHPFREGNGRSTRIFFEQLAKNAGYELNWSKVPREEYLQSVIKAQDHLNGLKDVFVRAIEPLAKSSRSLSSLKDVILQTKGYPSIYNDFALDHHALNKRVLKYKVDQIKDNRYLTFQFKGEEGLHRIKMEDMPYMTQDVKHELLSRAANNVQQRSSLDKGLGK